MNLHTPSFCRQVDCRELVPFFLVEYRPTFSRPTAKQLSQGDIRGNPLLRVTHTRTRLIIYAKHLSFFIGSDADDDYDTWPKCDEKNEVTKKRKAPV